jgi:hypothetical protein
MRGTWQGMIPVQGAGDRVIGEVARANFSNDNYEADKIAKADLHEEWTLPSHQNDPNGESLLKPLPIPAQLGRERAKVASFFAGVAEVLGGLMCLYEDPQSFGEGFNPDFGKKLKYSVLADSTVLLDSGQRISRLNEFINSYAKSGWVNIEPVLQEIATLSGLDPNIVIRPPQPKPPVEPNISLRLTGVEDLLTPMALAFMIKSGQAPDAQAIEQAKALIQQSVVPPQPPPGVDQSGMPSPLGAPPMGMGKPTTRPTRTTSRTGNGTARSPSPTATSGSPTRNPSSPTPTT